MVLYVRREGKKLLRLCWAAWRLEARAARDRTAAAAAATAAAEAKAARASLGPRLERPDLYRMSYEALIDKVLELQGPAAPPE